MKMIWRCLLLIFGGYILEFLPSEGRVSWSTYNCFLDLCKARQRRFAVLRRHAVDIRRGIQMQLIKEILCY
jgi:hypothetical protein